MARGRPKSSTAMSGKDRMKKLRAKHGPDKGMDAWGTCMFYLRIFFLILNIFC